MEKKYLDLGYSWRDKKLRVFMVEEENDRSNGYCWIDKVEVNGKRRKIC